MKVAAALLILLAGCSPQVGPTIIHILDYHFVPRDAFAADLRDQTDEPITDAEIDRQYAEFLDTVESVQVEQATILRGLMREQGIRQVFVEGLTDEKVADFRQAVDDLRGFDFDRLYQRLKDESLDAGERADLQDAVATLRARRLELGAVAQLMLADEPIDVAPLDDARMLEVADPRENGFEFGGEGNVRRERAMVKRMLEGGPVSVCILGGGHDLADEIKAQNPRVKYQRVETEAHRKATGNQN